MRTSELTGAALDWAVAKCEDPDLVWDESSEGFVFSMDNPLCFLSEFEPSADWYQGGPIIEREGIGIYRECTRDWERVPAPLSPGTTWEAIAGTYYVGEHECPGAHGVTCEGPTPLIAAMRCFVASRLGDEVDIPQELIT